MTAAARPLALFGMVGALIALTLGVAAPLAAVTIVGSAAPVAFSAIVMAERETLDVGLAAAAASLSALVALVALPVLLTILSP